MRWAALAVAGLLVLPGCGGVPDVLLPPRGGGFDHQLGGADPTAAGVGIVVRDREDPADPALYSVCHVNAFRTQPGDTSIPGELLLRDADGDAVEDPAWPGEFLLDISTEDHREALLQVVGGWIDGCAAAELADDDLGFDFAITEDCAAFDECDLYAAAYDVVLDVGYGPCDAAPEQVRVLRRDLALTTPGTPGYVFEECGS
ncbi:endo alpha-1,4 polygalactosaminidase [Blastococcus sp. SYSU D00669]